MNASTFSFSAQLSSAVARLVVIAGVILCLGIPINDTLRFAVLVFACVLVFFGKLRIRGKHLWLPVVVVAASMYLQSYIPHIGIHEGHNVFVFKQSGEPLEQGLPPQVYAYLKEKFLQEYPPGNWCEPKDNYGCWRGFDVPQKVFSLSGDAIFSNPRYSRTIDRIDFNSLTTLRGGFANEITYNWYDFRSDVKRPQMPYFVMYELPASTVGSLLCWRGNVLWESTPNKFAEIIHTAERCREIHDSDVGRRVFVDGIAAGGTLTMRLSPTLPWRMWEGIRFFIRLTSAVLLLSLTIRVQIRKLAWPLGIVSFAAVSAALYKPQLLEYFPHAGAGDGLVYEGYGRAIVAHALEGDWLNALRGGSDVFYFMPGMRYVRAIEKVIFGDTNFGVLLIILFAPLSVFSLTSTLFSRKGAVTWTIIFLALPIFYEFGFWYFTYVRITAHGLAEPIAYTAFMAGTACILANYQREDGGYKWYGLMGHLGLAVAVILRPNIAVPVAVLAFFSAAYLASRRRFAEIIVSWLGMLPIMLVPLHNFWFGRELVLFTASAAHPGNLQMPPAAYLNAFLELTRFDFSGENMQRMNEHLLNWIGRWYQWYRLPFLVLTVWAIFSRLRLELHVRILAAVCLSWHVLLLFYSNQGRYSYMAWTLALLVGTVVLREWRIDRITYRPT